MDLSTTQRTRYLIVGIAALLLLGYLLRGGGVDTTLIGTDITVTRVERNGERTVAASVHVPFTREADLPVANVAMDLNGDGAIAAYDLGNGDVQEEWVVRNMRALVITAGNTYSFDLHDPAADARTDLAVTVALTKTPLDAWDGTLRKGAGTQATVAAIGVEDFGGLLDLGDPKGTGAADGDGMGSGYPQTDDDLVNDVPAGSEAWVRDLTASAGEGSGAGTPAADPTAIGATPATMSEAGFDFAVFQPDVPDMSQGTNECVPTSTSNALHWLGEQYGFSDRLPRTQRETMEELKPDFSWTRADGVYVEPNYVPGKVAFTRRHDLPIVTHQIGRKFDERMVDNIAAELAKGQAVEVVIGYYTLNDSNEWVRNGGHMMSAVGAFGAGDRRYLGLHDPLSQESGRLDMYPVTGSRMYDYRYRGNAAVFIEYAIAESPTEAWLRDHPPRAALRTEGAIAEAANLNDVWTVDMIQIGNAWYPTVQFHTFTGPECDRQEHWHANTGTAAGIDLQGIDYFNLNPQRVAARVPRLVSWSDPDGCGAGKTAEVRRHNVLINAAEAMQLVGKVVP